MKTLAVALLCLAASPAIAQNDQSLHASLNRMQMTCQTLGIVKGLICLEHISTMKLQNRQLMGMMTRINKLKPRSLQWTNQVEVLREEVNVQQVLIDNWVHKYLTSVPTR